MTLAQQVQAFKATVVRATLTATRGNVTHAAQRLGLKREHLYRHIQDLKIDLAQVRAEAHGGRR